MSNRTVTVVYHVDEGFCYVNGSKIMTPCVFLCDKKKLADPEAIHFVSAAAEEDEGFSEEETANKLYKKTKKEKKEKKRLRKKRKQEEDQYEDSFIDDDEDEGVVEEEADEEIDEDDKYGDLMLCDDDVVKIVYGKDGSISYLEIDKDWESWRFNHIFYKGDFINYVYNRGLYYHWTEREKYRSSYGKDPRKNGFQKRKQIYR